MGTPVFYFYGGEDIDFTQVIAVGMSIDTTSTTFRAGYARCSLKATNNPGSYWRSARPFATNLLWFGARTLVSANLASTSYIHWGLTDVSGIPRLKIQGWDATFQYRLVTSDSSGALTQLGPLFAIPYALNTIGKLDIFVEYSTAGFVAIYFNEALIFSYVGDVTTNGVTSLSYLMLGCAPAGNSGVTTWWSEVIVSDSDTRGMEGLVTLAPVANGNTHNFDQGTPAASNVNKIVIDDSTFDGASLIGLIDQYTIGAIPAGSWQIASVGIVARGEASAFGSPNGAKLGVRSNLADWWGPSLTFPILAYQNTFVTTWEVDPSTGVTWSALPSNIGLMAA